MVPTKQIAIQPLADLINSICSYMSDPIDIEAVRRVATEAESLESASILAHMMRADLTTLIVGLVGRSEGVRLDDEARELLNAVERLNSLEHQRYILAGHKSIQPGQARAIAEMMLVVPNDPRAVLIRMAELLVEMRHNEASAVQSKEAQTIYAPLAGQLGLYQVESALEDEAFKLLEPESYAWIRDLIALGDQQQRDYVKRVFDTLHSELETVGIRADVHGRVKHVYSFYRKLLVMTGAKSLAELQSANIEQVNDIIAFRIIVRTKAECYRALNQVHVMWKPQLKRIKDFIAYPKKNGYQSIHTTVTCLDGKRVEIQIRTHEMHEYAEYGAAMHWHYKVLGDRAPALDGDSSDLSIESGKRGLSKSVFIFTPQGDIRKLPMHATPLDFAYSIHSAVGNQCAGALVLSLDDGYRHQRMLPLDEELSHGDMVSIVTNRHAHPNQSWLGLIHTKKAREDVRRFIKAHAISDERVAVKGLIADPLAAPRPNANILKSNAEQSPARSGSINVAGMEGLLFSFAKCCMPTYGTEIIGFVSRAKGVVIHRQDCHNIKRMHSIGKLRLVATDWAIEAN